MPTSRSYNGRISGRSAGAYRVRVKYLDFGLGIIASADNHARTRRAFYPVVTTGSSFTMTLVFISYEEREAYNRWMGDFMTKLANGTAKHGSLNVQVPSRNFVRTCVPDGSLEYGEGVGDLAYTLAQSFIGASDPVDITKTARQTGRSYFVDSKDKTINQFYPRGQQVAGAEALEGTLYDQPGSVEPFVVDYDDGRNVSSGSDAV